MQSTRRCQRINNNYYARENDTACRPLDFSFCGNFVENFRPQRKTAKTMCFSSLQAGPFSCGSLENHSTNVFVVHRDDDNERRARRPSRVFTGVSPKCSLLSFRFSQATGALIVTVSRVPIPARDLLRMTRLDIPRISLPASSWSAERTFVPRVFIFPTTSMRYFLHSYKSICKVVLCVTHDVQTRRI